MAITNLLTAEDLALIDEPPYRYELVEGEQHRMPPAGGEHGEVGSAVGRHIGNHAMTRRQGRVYGSDTGFLLATNPDTVFAPGVACVRVERLPPHSGRIGFLRIVPNIVVEVVSPSDRAADVAAKIRRHLAYGGPLV